MVFQARAELDLLIQLQANIPPMPGAAHDARDGIPLRATLQTHSIDLTLL